MAPEVITIEVLPSEAAVGELRTSLSELGNQLREMREKPEDQRSDAWAREMRNSAHVVYGMDAELRVLERVATEEREAKWALDRRGFGPEGQGANMGGDERENRSLGKQVVENEELMTWLKRSSGAGTSPDIEVRTTITEGAYGDVVGGSLWVPRGTPYLPTSAIDRRRLFIRDLLANGTTNLQAIPYIRETNPRVYELGASAVAEGTAKPEVAILFEQDLAPVRKLAAWVPVTSEILEDAPTLESYIDGRLDYMLRVREEMQLLSGLGTGAELRGILQTPNVQGATGATTDIPALIGKMIGMIENVDGDADGGAMNALDYWGMITARHATYLDAGLGVAASVGTGLPYGEAPSTVWGLPMVRTRSMTQGSVLIGAFQTGAQLFDRSTSTIRVGNQHNDYFIKNLVAILIEERLALAVYRPDWFVNATFS